MSFLDRIRRSQSQMSPGAKEVKEVGLHFLGENVRPELRYLFFFSFQDSLQNWILIWNFHKTYSI